MIRGVQYGEIVSVSGQPASPLVESAYEELHDTFRELRTSPEVREVITAVASERGQDTSAISFESDKLFLDSAQQALDFRVGGKARWQLLPTEFVNPSTDEAVSAAVSSLQQKKATVPTQTDVIAAIDPGSSGRIPRDRVEYLLELEKNQGSSFPMFIFASCLRAVETYKDPTGKDEHERAGSAALNDDGSPAKTEYDIMRNTARDAFKISPNDWVEYAGRDRSVPSGFEEDYHISYADVGGRQIFVLAAPVIGPDRYHPDGNPRWRANTGDTYLMAAAMLSDHLDGSDKAPNVVISTNAVFQFQGADAKNVFSRVGINPETVYYPQEAVGQPDWYGGNTFYLQEMLSHFRQTYNARNELGALLLKSA